MPQSDHRGLRLVSLLLVDMLVINLAFVGAHWLRYGAGLGGPVALAIPYAAYAPWGLVLTALLIPIYRLEGLYARRRRQTGAETAYAVATGTIVGVALLTVLLYGLRPEAQSRLMLPYATVLIVVGISITRWLNLLLRRRRLRQGIGVVETLVVGAGETGRRVMGAIMADSDMGYRVLGFLDDDPVKRDQPLGRFPPLGDTVALGRILHNGAPTPEGVVRKVDAVVIALPWQAREHIVQLADMAERAGAQVHIVPDLFQMSLNRVDMATLGGLPLIAVRAPVVSGWTGGVKRTLDVLVSGGLLILFAPLLVVIALLIKLDSSGPVLYVQPRVGTGGRLFRFFKFRSMQMGAHGRLDSLRAVNEASGPLFKMKRDPRVTRVGRWLRRYSLDELPQLWNVLKGDMSMVGPRPPIPDEVERYAPWHRRRLEMAPGLTGLWQVSGRSDLNFDEMVMLDLYYAENWSLGLDLKILLRTVPTVLLGTGAY
ncbi:MAG: sugar transferase [Ardenticatenia bacterium]|nr:sugar transferase [Ardenticatenia bacterium]